MVVAHTRAKDQGKRSVGLKWMEVIALPAMLMQSGILSHTLPIKYAAPVTWSQLWHIMSLARWRSYYPHLSVTELYWNAVSPQCQDITNSWQWYVNVNLTKLQFIFTM